MSELIQKNDNRATIRWKLLTGVSSFALAVAVSTAKPAEAADADRPLVWIDLGGQMEQLGNRPEDYAPSFLAAFDHLDFQPVLPVQHTLPYALGEEGAISFSPESSNWVFSAAIRYSKKHGTGTLSQRLPALTYKVRGSISVAFKTNHQIPPYHLNASASNSEKHTILDFEAGKDIGLGSSLASSTVSAGVRFAQFGSHSRAELNGVPDFSVSGQTYIGIHTGVGYGVYRSHHRYFGTMTAERSFRGIGPAVSWKASARIAGQKDSSELMLDWGLNAAVLFGRQKMRGGTETTTLHYKFGQKVVAGHPSQGVNYNTYSSSHVPSNFNRSRRITVPNIGAFAGVSFQYADAKVSLGYRADMFFNAMDNGIATRKSADQFFYGPYASISIGLGD